uniref:Uncharacterized protein n=1 Tax=Anguilla anguilla TaxID=7936 RepID=A0A0E9TF31_ANGAN
MTDRLFDPLPSSAPRPCQILPVFLSFLSFLAAEC